MPLLNSLTKIATKPVPSVISPRGHAIFDYITVGAFLMSAGCFWQRSKRAALAALICAGAELALSLLTEYPGGVNRVISFRTHGDIDLGLAAMAATMPELLAFKDDRERKFFLVQGALMTAATELTKFPDKGEPAGNKTKRAKAA